MIIQIRVFPKSEREEIIQISENSFKVYLKKQAHHNKANMELIKMLKRYFNCQHIKVIKGLNSKDKVIEID
jgi:uncharacterized protein (TIGR00251 family)